MPKTARASKCRKLPHPAILSVQQENAVDALVSGKNDAETAAIVGVDRTTVNRWRLYSPAFQAALNARRVEVWSVGSIRMQGLIPKALDVLAEELDKPDSPNRLKAALELLRLVPPEGLFLTPGSPLIGPTDPDEIVRRRVEELRVRTIQERENAKAVDEENDDYSNAMAGLLPMPTNEELTATVLKEIDARLKEPVKAKPEQQVN
jgi:hypothetical protein